MNTDSDIQEVMDRVRRRKLELSDQNASKENAETPVLGDPSSKWNANDSVQFIGETAAPTKNVDTLPESNQRSRRSAFDEIGEEFNRFDYSPRKQLTKDDVKKPSPRLSIGEATRTSKTFTPVFKSPIKTSSPSKEIRSPVKNNDRAPHQLSTLEEEESRRIRFAHPIASTTTFEEYSSSAYCSTTVNSTINESSIIAGSGYTQAMPSFADNLNDNLSSDEYGAHTFIKKKTPVKSTSSSSLKIGSPKPFVRECSSNSFSPVHFNPTNTSSPKIVATTVTLPISSVPEYDVSDANLRPVATRKDFIDDLEAKAKFAASPSKSTPTKGKNGDMEFQHRQGMSPVRSAALESARAKTIAQQLEDKLRGTNSQVPQPKAPITAAPMSSRNAVTPTQGFQTQFRGNQGTPVVTGTDKTETTKPDVGSSNLKSLKNRWEFSSITGTPIHPDESEDALLSAALRIRDTCIPKRDFRKQPVSAAKVESTPLTPRSDRKTYGERAISYNSPAAKSPRYEEAEVSEDGTPSPVRLASKSPKRFTPRKSPIRMEEPETVEQEDIFADNEDSEEGSAGNAEANNMSKFIDDAFDFMGKSPAASLAPQFLSTPAREAPLATMESTPDFLRDDVVSKRADLPKSNWGTAADLEHSQAPADSSAVEQGSSLPYSISFYRKRGKMQSVDPDTEKIDLTMVAPSAPSQQIIGGVLHDDDDEDIEEVKLRLEQDVKVQQAQIAQASRALQHCKNQVEFRGSREEVDAQRALLVATETRRATVQELERITRDGRRSHDGPRGGLTISSIVVNLSREFISGHSGYGPPSDSIMYFIVLLKCCEHVIASSIVNSDQGLKRKGVLEFDHYMNLKDLSPDFVCLLEIYALRTSREQFTHEEKYHLNSKGTSGKSKTLSRSSNMSSGGPAAISDSSFQMVGRLSINIDTNTGKKVHNLQNTMMPLDGTAVVKMKKHAMGRSNTEHHGFLSMFQKTKEGLGSWNRYWCVLNGGEMKFWRAPEDASNDKNWLVLLDLQTCAGDGASTVREICPYPNSFHIDVWVPKENANTTMQRGSGRPEMEKLRVMLAADMKSDMAQWLQMINMTAKHMLMWNRTMP